MDGGMGRMSFIGGEPTSAVSARWRSGLQETGRRAREFEGRNLQQVKGLDLSQLSAMR